MRGACGLNDVYQAAVKRACGMGVVSYTKGINGAAAKAFVQHDGFEKACREGRLGRNIHKAKCCGHWSHTTTEVDTLPSTRSSQESSYFEFFRASSPKVTCLHTSSSLDRVVFCVT